MFEGDLAIVNGEHERIIHFDDAGEIQLENWNWDTDFVFSIRKKNRDDRYEDRDDPTLETPTIPASSPMGKYR